jgi:hypothetical protein
MSSVRTHKLPFSRFYYRQTPIYLIFHRNLWRYIEGCGKAKCCIRGNFCSQFMASGESLIYAYRDLLVAVTINFKFHLFLLKV